jgi:small subunit ribosomal protein S16
MAVKIRLQRHGRKKAPFYHIVIADSRAPRDGKFIEKIGTYNPMTSPATIDLDRDAAFAWMEKGAQPTDTAAAILRVKGVMYRKHLQRGVTKGALTAEVAATRYQEFVESKDKTTSESFAKSAAAKVEKHVALFGTPKAKKVVEAPVVEAVVEAPVVVETIVEAPVVVETIVEAPVVVETIVEAPAVVETIVETAPVVEAVVETPAVETVVENVGGDDPELAAMEAKAEAEG